MALPSTGGTYAAILQPGINEEAIRKAIVTDILIRDYNGPYTDLSASSVGLNEDGYFAPYAENGDLRDDLLITAEGANLGFYHVGGLAESGVQFTPNVNVEPTRIAQSRRAVRQDITEEDVEIQFTLREASPIADLLRADKPLMNVPDFGTRNYVVAAPAEGQIVTRQIIALLFDGTHQSAMILPRAQRANVGETNWNKTDPDDLQLTYGGLMCPFAGYPWAIAREGSGWRGLGGFPVFSASAPTATGGVGTATVALAVPTGVGDPWTYTVEKSVNAGSTWSSATVGSSNVAGGNITFNITGLAAGATVFRVTAEGSNGLESTSSVSNSVTITS